MIKHAQLPQLTGIRAVAFLMVFFFHVGFHGFLMWSGVDLFFVLSGYLITGILLTQDKTAGYFRVFYARRFLRIFPPFYLVLALGLIVLDDLSKPQLSSIVLFYTNLYSPFAETTTAPLSYWALSPYWSLALEEQFYLLWPLMVYKLSTRGLLRLCLALIVLSPLMRALTYEFIFLPQVAGYEAIFHFPWNRLDLLASGAAIAVCQREGSFARAAMARSGLWLTVGSLAIIGLFAALFPEFRYSGHSLLFSTLGLSAVCGVTSGVILYLTNTRSGFVVKLLSWAPVVYIGTISYTLYLLHGIVLVALTQHTPLHSGWLYASSALAVTVALAALSWSWIERPAKQIKDSPRFLRFIGIAASRSP